MRPGHICTGTFQGRRGPHLRVNLCQLLKSVRSCGGACRHEDCSKAALKHSPPRNTSYSPGTRRHSRHINYAWFTMLLCMATESPNFCSQQTLVLLQETPTLRCRHLSTITPYISLLSLPMGHEGHDGQPHGRSWAMPIMAHDMAHARIDCEANPSTGGAIAPLTPGTVSGFASAPPPSPLTRKHFFSSLCS